MFIMVSAKLFIGCMFFFSVHVSYVTCFIEGMYCGRENCYEVLGISKEASRDEVARAYRSLARKFHPDVHKTEQAKKKATERFTVIATAYEVLKDEDTRKDYDYMLENPDEVYRHYYRYYRRMVAPKVDVRYVIAATIIVISTVQYFGACMRYESALDYLVTVPKYRIKALETAKEEGLLSTGKRRGRQSKEEIRQEEESVIRKILARKVDIRGGYAKPSVRNTLLVQLIFLPYTVGWYIWWNLRWFYNFTICRREYGKEEKIYLIKKYLKASDAQWEATEDKEKEEYLEKELWIREKFKEWWKQKEEDIKASLAEKAGYKRYRRYMKNRGPGQITFDDS